MSPRGSLVGVLAIGAMLSAAPAAYAVDPTGDPGDTTPPATVALAVLAPEVAVSEAPASVVVTVRVTDEGSGVTNVSVRLGDTEPVALAPLNGDSRDGQWSGPLTVAQGTPAGIVTAYVEARDASGNAGTYSQQALRVTDAPPAAPVAVTTEPRDGGLRVLWDAPPANGTSPVEGYTVTAEPMVTDPAPVVVKTAADARETVLPGLADGVRYVVRVAASNALGTGPAATTDATVGTAGTAPATTPSAPDGLTAVPLDRAIGVSWTAVPGATSYEVRASAADVAVPVTVTGTTATVSGLTNGVPYDVTVTAVNSLGAGLPATTQATPRTVPPAPVVGVVTPGDRSAVVRWTQTGNGGDSVHSFVVTVHPAGTKHVIPGTLRTATIGGLVNGAAVTFTVVARNDAGAGPSSAASAPVTPRKPVRLGVATLPARAVTYGTGSNAAARLTTLAGTPIAGRRLELQAQLRPSTTWSGVGSGVTDANGVVRVRAVLPKSATLRLYHPADTYAAAYATLGTVAVAPRITATASDTTLNLGSTVVVTGTVSPGHPIGQAVYLQRWTTNGWANLTRGAMTTTSAYRVDWKPGIPGAWTLRVVKPGDGDHATGASNQWRQSVAPTSVSIAQSIKANTRIVLDTIHTSGRIDGATARANIVDVAAGRLARLSAYENAPGGYTRLDLRLLRALQRMGERGSVTVSEIAGGSHSRGSTHYYGRGLDIRSVNGVPVRRGSSYGMAVEACRAFGAVRIFHPSYDPYGGHQGHVHCDWA